MEHGSGSSNTRGDPPTHTRWERAALPLTGASAGLFGALSAIRRNRVFHPVGDAFTGTLRLFPAEQTSFRLALLDGETHETLVRFSRGAGLPEPLPDVLGLAVKIRGLADGGEQDLLLASSGRSPGTRNLLVPARSFFRCTYTTVLPYRVNDEQVMFGADAEESLRERGGSFGDVQTAAATGALRFDLLAARLGGPWETVGTLAVEGKCEQSVARDLRFNPWRTTSELVPAGPLNTLRKNAYRSSQRARPS